MADDATEPSELDGNSYGITSRVRRETAGKIADGIPRTTAPAPAFIADCEQSNAAPVSPLTLPDHKNFSYTLLMCSNRANGQTIANVPLLNEKYPGSFSL